MSEDKEVIVVKGARPKPNTGLASEKDDGGFSPFVPDFIKASNWEAGLGGAELPVRVRLFTRMGLSCSGSRHWESSSRFLRTNGLR